MSCGVGGRLGSEPALLWLWLWHRPVATSLIGPLAWEPPYAAGASLKRQKKKKKRSFHFSSSAGEEMINSIHKIMTLSIMISENILKNREKQTRKNDRGSLLGVQFLEGWARKASLKRCLPDQAVNEVRREPHRLLGRAFWTRQEQGRRLWGQSICQVQRRQETEIR